MWKRSKEKKRQKESRRNNIVVKEPGRMRKGVTDEEVIIQEKNANTLHDKIGKQYKAEDLFILLQRVQNILYVNPLRLDYVHPCTPSCYNLVCCKSFHKLR